MAASVASFSGNHRYVLDYLTEEVRNVSLPSVRDFLLETSVLERLSGDLCDAVTGRRDGQAMLERHRNGRTFCWCRWMRHVAGGAITICSQTCSAPPCRTRRQPRPGHRACAGPQPLLVPRTSVSPQRCRRYALAAGDPVWAARLVEQPSTIFLQGESETVQRWLSGLPAELVRARPRLCLAQAWMALVGGDVDGAGPPPDAAARARGRRGRAVRAVGRPGSPRAGERPRRDRARSRLPRLPARRRRGYRRRVAGPGPTWRGRVDAGLVDSVDAGLGGLAAWPA